MTNQKWWGHQFNQLNGADSPRPGPKMLDNALTKLRRHDELSRAENHRSRKKVRLCVGGFWLSINNQTDTTTDSLPFVYFIASLIPVRRQLESQQDFKDFFQPVPPDQSAYFEPAVSPEDEKRRQVKFLATLRDFQVDYSIRCIALSVSLTMPMFVCYCSGLTACQKKLSRICSKWWGKAMCVNIFDQDRNYLTNTPTVTVNCERR